MALRKLSDFAVMHGNDQHTAHVYRDSEWEEYRVKFAINGIYLPKADYHTDNRDDAISTARSAIQSGLKKPRIKRTSTPIARINSAIGGWAPGMAIFDSERNEYRQPKGEELRRYTAAYNRALKKATSPRIPKPKAAKRTTIPQKRVLPYNVIATGKKFPVASFPNRTDAEEYAKWYCDEYKCVVHVE